METALILLLIVFVAMGTVLLFGVNVNALLERGADGTDGQLTPAANPGGGSNAGGGGSGIPGVPTTSTSSTTSSTTTTTTAP